MVVHIENIGEYLEGEKGNAKGESNLQVNQRGVKQQAQLIDGEGQVFEYKKEQHMKGYIRYQYLLPKFRIGAASDGTCRQPAKMENSRSRI